MGLNHEFNSFFWPVTGLGKSCDMILTNESRGKIFLERIKWMGFRNFSLGFKARHRDHVALLCFLWISVNKDVMPGVAAAILTPRGEPAHTLKMAEGKYAKNLSLRWCHWTAEITNPGPVQPQDFWLCKQTHHPLLEISTTCSYKSSTDKIHQTP